MDIEDNDNIRVPFSSGYSAPSHKEYMKQMQTDLHKHFKKYKKTYGGKMKFNQFAPKFIKEYAEGFIVSVTAFLVASLPPIPNNPDLIPAIPPPRS